MERYRIYMFRRPGPLLTGRRAPLVCLLVLALIVGIKGEQNAPESPASPLLPSASPSSSLSPSVAANNMTLVHSSPSVPKVVHSVVRSKHGHSHHVHHYPHHYRAHYHTNQRIQWAPRTATGQLAANATRAVTNMVGNVNHAIHSFFHSRPKARSSAAGSPFFKFLTGESIISNAASKLFPSASKLLQARKSDNESRRFISGVVAGPTKPSLSLLSLSSPLPGSSSLSSSSSSSSSASSSLPALTSSSPSSSSPFSFTSAAASLFDSHRLLGSESAVNEVTVNATEHLNTTSGATYSSGTFASGNNRTNEAAINLDSRDGARLRDEIVGRVSNIQTALTHAIEFSKDRREYISNKLLEQTNLRLEQAKERTHRFLSDPRNQEMTAKAIYTVNTGIEKTNNWFQGMMARVGQTILDRAAQRVQQQKEKQLEEIRLEKSRNANSTLVESTTAKSNDKQ